jgi:3-phenylpropionate/trans-cinnamate dioxygenase ferredoxin subunit
MIKWINPFPLCHSRFALRALLSHNAIHVFINTSGGEQMADVSIRPKPNGPYLIEGPVDVYDTAGNKIATDDRPRIALCRCGASSNKPFCDGTHSKIGFQAAETINPESAE